MTNFAKRLKEAMEKKGYKQSDLIERTGISSGAISSYLSGGYTPKQNNIYLLAEALDVSEAYLLGWEKTTVRLPRDGDITEDLTEEEIEEVLKFINYLKSKRKKY